MATNIITFGEIATNKYNQPILPVYSMRDGHETTQYLLWFRKKSFQICATPEGEWDFGSSDIVPEPMQQNKAVMRAFAIEALTNFGSNSYSELRFSLNTKKNYQLDKFIQTVIESL